MAGEGPDSSVSKRSCDRDNLPDYLRVMVVPKVLRVVVIQRVWMDNQRVVLEAATGAQVGSVTSQQYVQRLLPQGA